MRFLADECCPAAIVAALRGAGHDVTHALEKHTGSSDAHLAAIAMREGRIVITEDYDFGELAVRGQLRFPGVIILFLNQTSSSVRTARVLEVVAGLGDGLADHLTIIDTRRTRRRPLPRGSG